MSGLEEFCHKPEKMPLPLFYLKCTWVCDGKRYDHLSLRNDIAKELGVIRKPEIADGIYYIRGYCYDVDDIEIVSCPVCHIDLTRDDDNLYPYNKIEDWKRVAKNLLVGDVLKVIPTNEQGCV